MENVITEFFESIYESTITEMPAFLVKAHEFDVTRALRNPTSPESAKVLAKEDAYAEKLDLLRDTYGKVLALLSSMPPDLRVATLHVVSGNISATASALGLSDAAMNQVRAELEDILSSHATPSPEQLQAAGSIIQKLEV